MTILVDSSIVGEKTQLNSCFDKKKYQQQGKISEKLEMWNKKKKMISVTK
jgi:hypothetical protein